ncbi:MAG: DUF7343 domain-containing protein [Nanoarchaeota archaeon]
MITKIFWCKLLLLVLIFIFVSNFIYSIDYYGNFNLTLTNSGTIYLDSKTNHPLFKIEKTDEFTSKDGKYWILNISVDDVFSDYIYYINFPKGTSINYIKTKSLSRIESTDSGITIIGIGENEKIKILVQYSINGIKSRNINYFNYIILSFIIIFIISFILALVINKFFLNRKNIVYDKKENIILNNLNYKEIIKKKNIILTKRQQLIVDLLKKENLTQTQIMNKLNLPKSSISRNINTLEKKGIIIKKQKGISNVIYLNK